MPNIIKTQLLADLRQLLSNSRQQLSKVLTTEFGKGFDVRNLRNMRTFYELFPIRGAVRTELSCSHHRKLK
ncbi:MAG: hypothetical protein COA71_13795 [SAR86 cluster bacterium]|uniref:YhcG N-terminal domain-containing protein n=1 Tax=SAR86 cluster bacterium TaxID=2030880 RepID=A0A2A5C7G6_9GAMM|nr:MAG: hypothetical protein COA71_13795 [SAR86 cluster bacterium]